MREVKLELFQCNLLYAFLRVLYNAELIYHVLVVTALKVL